MIFYKGENIIVKGTLTNDQGVAINFTDLTTFTAKLVGNFKQCVTYTKAAGDITAGDTASSYQFEILASDTAGKLSGKTTAYMTASFVDVDFSLTSVDINEVYIGEIKEIGC